MRSCPWLVNRVPQEQQDCPPPLWPQLAEPQAGAVGLPSWQPCIPAQTTWKYASEEGEFFKRVGGKGRGRKISGEIIGTGEGF